MLRCYFCAQARAFQEVFVCCDATFVHRHVGFKRFLYAVMLLLCTGVWVLRGFCTLRCHFCAQALGFSEVFVCCDATFVHRRMGFK